MTYSTSTTAAIDPMDLPPTNAELDVVITTVTGETVKGWIHMTKTTDEALAIMVGRRKTPRMVPVGQILSWVQAW